MIHFTVLILSMFITLALIPPFRAMAVHYGKVDFPNERKVHQMPVPRVGGIAMGLGCFIPVIFWAPIGQFAQYLALGAAIIVLFGILDDFKNLGYKVKMTGQALAAGVVVFGGGLQVRHLGQLLPPGVDLPVVIGIPLTLIAVIGVTNAINLSDGLDGLAGGLTLLIFACLGYLALQSQIFLVLTISVAISGAIIGFLRFNTHPAVVFMGDTGSQLLGYLAICLSLYLTQENRALSPTLPLILLGFPVLDTLAVMVERIVRGHSPFKADKNHFHHKLMRLGLTHSESVLTIYAIQSTLVLLAFVLRYYSDWLIVAIYALFCTFVVATFTIADKTGWQLLRTDWMDRLIAARIRVLRKQVVVIKICFKCVEFGAPALLIITCLIPAEIPLPGAAIALVFAVLLVISVLSNRQKGLPIILRLAVYLTIPFVVFYCNTCLQSERFPIWVNYAVIALHLSITLFAVMTLKYTRRLEGFLATPMDFLVLFVAIALPNLPDPTIQSLKLGFPTTQIIVMLFIYEVLLGELRGRLRRQAVLALLALLIVAVKGLA